MKPWLRRTLLVLGSLELCYLVLGNLALNLPLAQTLINQHRPEKYAVHWERAWTWYPLRVHARGVSADGQTGTLQWGVEASAASASVALLPLLRRTVKVDDAEVEDVEYRQRPRPTPEKDYAASREFFAPIPGRSLDSPVVVSPAAKKGPGWTVLVEDIHASGKHRVWLYQIQGAMDGDLYADVSFQSRGGPFSLRNGRFDLHWDSLAINDGQRLSDRGSIQGTLAIAPYVPSEYKGIKMLPFVDLDADVTSVVDSLQFLNFYLRSIRGIQIDGSGTMTAAVKLSKGKLLQGTKLAVSSPDLSLTLAGHRIEGTGKIAMEVRPDEPESVDLGIKFGALSAYHDPDRQPLFNGEGLTIRAKGPNRLVPDEGQRYKAQYLAVQIPSVTAPDLRRFRRYLPKPWPIELHGGSGKLEAGAKLTRTAFHAGLTLQSGNADVAFKDYRFKTDLDLGISVDVPSLPSGTVEVSGTYLRLDNAILSTLDSPPEEDKGADEGGREQARSKPWQAALTIEKGVLQLPMPTREQTEFDTKTWAKDLAGTELETILANADGEVRVDGTITNLGWINLFLQDNPYSLSIDGTGRMGAELQFNSGQVVAGSTIDVRADKLDVKVLDYLVRGNGSVAIEIEKGGTHPDLGLNVEVDYAILRRPNEKQAYVRDVTLKLSASSRFSKEEDRNRIVALHIRIPSASVTDMAVYDQFLPEHSPLRLLAGKANLVTDIRLKPDSARGFVKLHTDGLRCRVDNQELSARLAADITIAGGVPRNMDFDISGSTLTLDKVKVVGEHESFDQADWSTQLDLHSGRVVWRRPIRLHIDAGVLMKDSRPIVAMIANKRGKASWLDKVLTIKDIRGDAKLNMEDDHITIPYAFASSDKLDIGAKGVIDAQTHDGVFYLRFHKLRGILKIRNGERNFDVIGAKKTFERYNPP